MLDVTSHPETAAIADMELKGLIFDIQRYTVHDGPGTRTSVFLKGCNLHCLWCCNPESQSMHQEVGIYTNRCIEVDKCGFCLSACPMGADIFQINEDNMVCGIDRNRCNNCLKCVEACPAEALDVIGEEKSVRELVTEILKDREFFDATGGGVTISGGELFTQPKFVLELLKACKQVGLHTCVESALCVPWSIIKPALPFIDFVITDIKHMDPEKHKKIVGGKLDLVLENIKQLSKSGKQTIIRIPLIPGYNDDSVNIMRTGNFIAKEFGSSLQQVQVLQFHELGKNKYISLNREYPLTDMLKPERDDYIATMRSAVDILKSQGLPAYADSKITMNR